ncbi:MAG: UvrD-helicase domain-containing protein [Cyclobacteriaceae bacterium]|nr:UvrD-helicase domain-containing protein [Cyclobacteriaceae bacterium]
MAEKPLVIYRSSAGSGKTRTLAKEYLKLALKHRSGYFRHVLAVTFTNKATQEMKERIVRYLNDFIDGRENSLENELKRELGQSDSEFKENCNELRAQILHQYSQFSISTIDAFFQKVIRSFTREAGLSGDYRLEVENEAVLEEVVNNLIDDIGEDKDLKRWMVDFATKNLESDKPWDVRRGLIDFSKEILRDDFKLIEKEFTKKTSDKKFLNGLLDQFKAIRHSFISTIKKKAAEGFQLIVDSGFDVTDFKYQGGAGYKFFKDKIDLTRIKDFKEPGVQVAEYLTDAANWPAPKSNRKNELFKLASSHLLPLRDEILNYREQNYARALSAEVVLENFYAFGLIADISKKLQEYKAENNMMLLADAPQFLQELIGDSDAPFIYEKTGSFFKNYLIDEFQDTSNLQWRNFVPLINESLSSNNRNVIVGDVKQAIYRWRGGDLTLLQERLEQQIGEDRVAHVNLSDNYRSAANIISFNNQLFKTASQFVSQETGTALAQSAYEDVDQQIKREHKGLVDIQFIENEKELKWKEQAKEQLVRTLEEWQEAGVKLKDIAILVRTNADGQELVAHLLKYKNSEEAKSTCKYDVISNESLRIDGAASVNLVLAAMRYLNNHLDVVARAELAYEFVRIHQSGMALSDVFSVTNEAVFESFLPQEFTQQKLSLRKLPLFEMTEMLIRIFRLSDQEKELAYLQAFQDIVLNFYSRERNDLQAFLEWWEENKDSDKTSVKTSGSIDAAEILTIHKSKGLQFKYVIIPFCSWTLDHQGFKQPNLWVQADTPMFKDAGYLSVKYSKTLTDTVFDSYYHQERTQIFLDNVNILYVALTRAELGMKIFAPSGKLTRISDVSDLLQHCIITNNQLTANWDKASLRWKVGSLEPVSTVSDANHEEITPISLKHYPVSRWRDKLVIRQAGKTYFDSDKEEKVKYGIHLHSVLSYIKTKGDVDAALQRAVQEGLLTTAEIGPVKVELEELFKAPLVSSWFDEGWEVRTEVPVILPGGEESRFDRLLLNDNKAVVIDFKTGAPSNANHHQVLAYMDILRNMNFTVVEGYVLYVRTGEVVEVKAGKVKTVKKKDDNQLELGL